MFKARKLLCANKSMKFTRGIRYPAMLISDSNGIKGNYTNVSADLQLSLYSQGNLSSSKNLLIMPDDTVMQFSGPLVLQFTTTHKQFSHTPKALMKNTIYNKIADNIHNS